MLPPDAFPGFVVLMGAMAIACAWFNGPLITLLQRHVPDAKMGRAMGLFFALTGLAAPIGVALGGVLAEAVGIAPFFLIDGLACLALGLVAYLPRSIRALDAENDKANADAAEKIANAIEKPVDK